MECAQPTAWRGARADQSVTVHMVQAQTSQVYQPCLLVEEEEKKQKNYSTRRALFRVTGKIQTTSPPFGETSLVLCNHGRRAKSKERSWFDCNDEDISKRMSGKRRGAPETRRGFLPSQSSSFLFHTWGWCKDEPAWHV